MYKSQYASINRSAVFFEMEEWLKCLDDIEAGLKYFCYPPELAYKLLDRKAKCLRRLGRLKEAKETFRQALAAADQATNLKPDKKAQLVADLESEMASIQDNSQENLEAAPDRGRGGKVGMECPFDILEPNGNFPVLADACRIAFDPVVGRHVQATRNINAGEVLNIEEAIASHLSPFKMKTNCVHCFRKFRASVLPSPVSR